MILDFELLYNIYTQDFISLVQNEDFYTEFMNKARSGNSEVSYMHRFIDKQIDLTWVEAIEEAIIPLDNIIRNPRRFIVQEEEIVNIELARKISPESIRHLAQHTNMIAKVEEDTVTPNRILNIFKEESFETYENRFIYTLLINLQYFISKRLKAIDESVDGNNVTSILFKDTFKMGKENVKCTFEMTIDSPGFKMDANLLDVDPEKLSKFQRIERIKKILYDFQNSPLIKALHGTNLVRPPIMRTNVLQKNPDFKKAKALWDFIETYREAGFNVEVTETNEIPGEEYLSDLYSTMILNYSLLKHHIGNEGDYEPQKKRKVITPKIIERTFFDVLDDLTFDIDVVKKIFNEQIAKTSKKRQKHEKEILAVIDGAIKTEKKRKDEIERARLAELERQKAERQRIRDELRKKREAEQQAKLLQRQEQQRLREEAKRKLEEEKLARRLEREEKKRLKEEEKKRLEEEKRQKAIEKAQQQKALEKQKELEKKRKEREKLKAQQEKLAQEEKERQRKAKEQQKLKELKAKELAAAKEAERKRKEREKLKVQQEKLAQEEKERQRKAKEQQKLKELKAKELAVAKEAERKRKEREKLKAQQEKLAAEEKERQRKQKEKLKQQQEKLAEAEKERQRKAKEQLKIKEQKAKELAAAKEAARKRKEREKLKREKEKQALIEKEKLRKAKEREKLKEKKAKEAALLKQKEAEIKAREKARLEALRQKNKK